MNSIIKSKDLSVILVSVGIASLLALFLSGAIFKTDNVKTSVEIVEPISSEFPALPETVFNQNSLNPTREITIGEGNQPTPFEQVEQ